MLSNQAGVDGGLRRNKEMWISYCIERLGALSNDGEIKF
jgi:hypothetical protein